MRQADKAVSDPGGVKGMLPAAAIRCPLTLKSPTAAAAADSPSFCCTARAKEASCSSSLTNDSTPDACTHKTQSLLGSGRRHLLLYTARCC